MAQKSDSAKSSQQVRGPQLREKIEESQEMGEQYRSENQGQDMLDTNVSHSSATTRNRSSAEHNRKK